MIGAIDGSHIPIIAPNENQIFYVNRKALLLQALCDRQYMFSDCYTGEVGPIHDACLFRRSHLCDDINPRDFQDGAVVVWLGYFALVFFLRVFWIFCV